MKTISFLAPLTALTLASANVIPFSAMNHLNPRIAPRDLELRWLITTKQPYQEGIGGIPDATVLTLVRSNPDSDTDPWVLSPVTREEAMNGVPYMPVLLYDTKVATAADNVCFHPDCQGLQLAAWIVEPNAGVTSFPWRLVDATQPLNGSVGASNIKGQGGFTQDDGHLLAIGTPYPDFPDVYQWDFSHWTLCDGAGTRVITFNGTDSSCESFYVQLMTHDPYSSSCI